MLSISITIQLAACAAMTGIIWMVQIAIYPLFARLEGKTFDDYHTRYMAQVSYVIAPFMFLEATSCAACLYLAPWQPQLLPTLLLALVWASTAFIQVPQHAKLTPKNVPALVHSNWIRTIAWSLRLLLLAGIFLSQGLLIQPPNKSTFPIPRHPHFHRQWRHALLTLPKNPRLQMQNHNIPPLRIRSRKINQITIPHPGRAPHVHCFQSSLLSQHIRMD